MGQMLREWRTEERWPIDALAEEVRERAPHLRRISREYVRRYELGAIDRRFVDLPYLAAVSAVLGHDVRELGPDIAKWADSLYTTLKPRAPKSPGKAARQVRTGSRYLVEGAARAPLSLAA